MPIRDDIIKILVILITISIFEGLISFGVSIALGANVFLALLFFVIIGFISANVFYSRFALRITDRHIAAAEYVVVCIALAGVISLVPVSRKLYSDYGGKWIEELEKYSNENKKSVLFYIGLFNEKFENSIGDARYSSKDALVDVIEMQHFVKIIGQKITEQDGASDEGAVNIEVLRLEVKSYMKYMFAKVDADRSGYWIIFNNELDGYFKKIADPLEFLSKNNLDRVRITKLNSQRLSELTIVDVIVAYVSQSAFWSGCAVLLVLNSVILKLSTVVCKFYKSASK
jgi:hypothetical protein